MTPRQTYHFSGNCRVNGNIRTIKVVSESLAKAEIVAKGKLDNARVNLRP